MNENNIQVTKESFGKAIALWSEWNEKINVISRKDIGNIYEHHILHSLAIAEYLSEGGRSLDGCSILDVGTGGGLPGIPLAMEYPGGKFTLCDSIGKKTTVARAVSEGLDLGNVECVNARAESLGRKFDYVVSRAVTSLDNFYPWVRGCFNNSILYLKGGDVNSEISQMCSKYGLDPHKVTVWPISDWLEDDYFAEKFVIAVEK